MKSHVPRPTAAAPASGSVSTARMAQDLAPSAASKSLYAQSDGLHTAVVTFVDYETLRVSIRMITGEEFVRIPFTMSFPGAGARHFMGIMPEIGDLCVVGFGATTEAHQVPIILGWYTSSAMAGHDWWPTQPFGYEEFGLSPAVSESFGTAARRVRHKLRHMRPGEAHISSSQGSDLVLNEGVLLANRRGGEIRLRDQDQAFVVRSINSFHVQSGSRVYAGPVQRSGILLPRALVSDGYQYDSWRQVDGEGNPLPINANTRNPATSSTVGVYQPDSVFGSGLPMGTADPNPTLYNSLYMDLNGRVSPNTVSDTSYGGKSLFRVGVTPFGASPTNVAGDSSIPALVEHRVEVAHASDGTLPVSEETDGFDADRVPPTDPRSSEAPSGARSINAPMVEHVLGTVVGNDPFSIVGRQQYGHPLRAQVFASDGSAAPAFLSGLGTPMAEHAAAMFRVTPPLDPSLAPTWWSVTKDGRVRASIGGPPGTASAEIAMQGGLRMSTGSSSGYSFDLSADGKIRINAKKGSVEDNVGVEVSSDSGAVRIFAGGNDNSSGPFQRLAPNSGGESGSPALTLEARTNVLLKAGRSITLSAPELRLQDISTLSLSGGNGISLQSGGSASIQAKESRWTSTGQSIFTFTGPTDFLPTNGPARRTTIGTSPVTGFVGGPADVYTLLYGDRIEAIGVGNHVNTIGTGTMTFATAAGVYSATGTGSSMVLGPGGAAVAAPVGAVAVTAPAGAATLTGGLAATVASAGPTVARGAVTILSAPGIKVGGIISQSDLDPLTGLPLLLLGMGSPTHLLSA